MSKLGRIREELPGLAHDVTQIVADNPGQFALIIAGTIVASRAAQNIVRPQTFVEAAALMLVLNAGLAAAAAKLIKSGVLQFQVRSEDGTLHRYVLPEAADAAGADSTG